MAQGYLNQPDLTAEKFIPDPFSKSAGERMYKTGDLAFFHEDGNLEFLGRVDHQIKLRGFRIELGEIEAVLAQHPAIREVAVIVRDQGGDKRLVAYVALASEPLPPAPESPEAEPTLLPPPLTTELRAFLRERLPDYMVPAELVGVKRLPLTPNGKVDRRALEALPAAQAESPRRLVPPRTATEQALVRIWTEVLKRGQVSVHDNFFESGGHSLLAVRLMARIRQDLGQPLPLATLFQNPTIEQLAVALNQHPEHVSSLLVPLQTGLPGRPPLFFVHPVGGSVLCYAELCRSLGPNQPFYGLQAQGLDGTSVPEPHLEAMAAHYLRLIQTVQPHGPYLLGGWSMGGVIAFEMAQQLRAQDQPVALLVLVDSHIPALEPEVDEVERLVEFGLGLGLAWTQVPALAVTLKSLNSQERLPALLKALPPEAGTHNLPLEQAHHLLQVFEGNTQALRHYIPQAYAGSVVLFMAQEQPGPVEEALGWRELVTPHPIVHHLPGNHYTLVRPPYVAALAERLAQALENFAKEDRHAPSR